MTVSLVIAHAVANAWPSPPSEGAHRLGWWIGEQADGADAILRVARECETSVALVDRLLSGEIEPAGTVAEQVAQTTAGAVMPGDWLRGASGGWADSPTDRARR